MGLLKRKGWCLDDVEEHPVVLGVPLGMVAGSGKTIAVDVGLKNPANISVAELMRCSPHAKSTMLTHALGGGEMPKINTVLQRTPPIPMALVTVEDIQKLPIATPMHPSALERRTATEDLEALQDPFFSSGGTSSSTWQQGDSQQQQQRAGLSEFTDLVIDQVPDADQAASVRREWQREQRRLQQIALGITPDPNKASGNSNRRPSETDKQGR